MNGERNVCQVYNEVSKYILNQNDLHLEFWRNIDSTRVITDHTRHEILRHKNKTQ